MFFHELALSRLLAIISPHNEVSDFCDCKQISFSRFYICWIGLSPLVSYLLSYLLLPLLPPPLSHTPASVLSLLFWPCIFLWTLLPFPCLLAQPSLWKISHTLPPLGKYCLPRSIWAIPDNLINFLQWELRGQLKFSWFTTNVSITPLFWWRNLHSSVFVAWILCVSIEYLPSPAQYNFSIEKFFFSYFLDHMILSS